MLRRREARMPKEEPDETGWDRRNWCSCRCQRVRWDAGVPVLARRSVRLRI